MITNSMMCVAKPYSPIDSTCNGDSGSSVMYKNGENYDTIGVVFINSIHLYTTMSLHFISSTRFLGGLKVARPEHLQLWHE